MVLTDNVACLKGTKYYPKRANKGLLTQRARGSTIRYISGISGSKRHSWCLHHKVFQITRVRQAGTAKLYSGHLNIRTRVSADAMADIIDSESNRRSVPLRLAFAIRG